MVISLSRAQHNAELANQHIGCGIAANLRARANQGSPSPALKTKRTPVIAIHICVRGIPLFLCRNLFKIANCEGREQRQKKKDTMLTSVIVIVYFRTRRSSLTTRSRPSRSRCTSTLRTRPVRVQRPRRRRQQGAPYSGCARSRSQCHLVNTAPPGGCFAHHFPVISLRAFSATAGRYLEPVIR